MIDKNGLIKHKKALDHWLNGGQIEVLLGDTWCFCSDPGFYFIKEYRIKPEPRTFWIIDNLYCYSFKSEESAISWTEKQGVLDEYEIIKVQEVLDDAD